MESTANFLDHEMHEVLRFCREFKIVVIPSTSVHVNIILGLRPHVLEEVSHKS